MNTGEKIRIFPETDVNAYIAMIHDAGFNCSVVRGKYIQIGTPRRMSVEQKQIIGRKITAEMKKRNMSRNDLATVLGLKNEWTVWSWQIGRSTPSEENRNKLKELGFEI